MASSLLASWVANAARYSRRHPCTWWHPKAAPLYLVTCQLWPGMYLVARSPWNWTTGHLDNLVTLMLPCRAEALHLIFFHPLDWTQPCVLAFWRLFFRAKCHPRLSKSDTRWWDLDDVIWLLKMKYTPKNALQCSFGLLYWRNLMTADSNLAAKLAMYWSYDWVAAFAEVRSWFWS